VWCNKFKDGRTALNGDPPKHRGRPRTSHTDENCVIVECLIREDQRVKVSEIAEDLDLDRYCKKAYMKLIQIQTSVKCLLAGFRKCSPRSTKAKQWLLRLKIFAVTKMKENQSWKASLWEMKHGFTSSPLSQKETPLQKTDVPYFTSLGKEQYYEGMYKLVKLWDKCLNANSDYLGRYLCKAT
jgi:hypothetical protein